MDIRPVNSAAAMAPANTATVPADRDSEVRQVVAAVREINKSELMGEGRELNFTRDPQTHKPVIQIVDATTGDVIDQLPPDMVLHLAANLK